MSKSTSKFAALSTRPRPRAPGAAPDAPEGPQSAHATENGAGEGAAPPEAAPAASQPVSVVVAPPKPKKGSRDGKVQLAGYFSEDLARQFKIIAVQEDQTVQGLLGEALDDLFRKYGQHPFGER